MKKVSLFLLASLLCCLSTAFAADEIADFNKRLAASKDNVEKANVLMDLGDYYSRTDKYDLAADAYLRALPDIRNSLTEDRWLQTAVNISLGGKLEGSIAELRLLLKRYPKNLKAKTQLAKVLHWSGNHDAALAEAESVLAVQADNRDALFIKAESLRFKGDSDGAIAIYQALLKGGDDFDTRLGLAYSYFNKEDYANAKKLISGLKPTYTYQGNDLKSLQLEIEKIESAKKAAVDAVGDKAYNLKLEGDALADREKFNEAAVKYEQALSISKGFSTADRLRMAQVISWAGKNKLARHLLEEIVSKEPGNVEARVNLIRVLTWSGELDAAIHHADVILAADPGNRDARLGKANALRIRGFFRKADEYYYSLLKQGEDFDVRAGLTNGFIASGRKTATDESLALIKTQYPYQENDLASLRKDRNWAFRPQLYTGILFYYDNDDNRVTTASAGTQFWLGNWRTNIDYYHIRSQGEATAYNEDTGLPFPLNVGNRNDIIQLSTYSRMPWYGGLGGGVGLSDGRFFTWNARTDLDLFYGNIGVSIAKEAFTSSAELVEKNIRATAFTATITQSPTDRITLTGSYAFREYSDSNGSNDISASIAYQFLRDPSMSIGYRFRYLDFRRQSEGGYFDPNEYYAHSMFMNMSFYARPFYGNIGPYIGYQDFNRNSEDQSGMFGGVAGLLGYWITDKIALEATCEWGNSLAGSSAGTSAGSGWYYYATGLRLIFSF
ncbi:MAG: tetratricopeptide repeat protein [Syntrophaceae bacterium]|nr:tetratricopeptide repeat protein [Syntrophaceae bacterium]